MLQRALARGLKGRWAGALAGGTANSHGAAGPRASLAQEPSAPATLLASCMRSERVEEATPRTLRQQGSSAAAAGGWWPAAAPSHSQQHTPPSGLDLLHQALGVAEEQALVARLAAVWQLPAEILGANVAALGELLQPAGLEAAPHALWVLVRCPALRHATEQQLRGGLRQLAQRCSALELDRGDLLRAFYRRPWLLEPAPPAASSRARQCQQAPAECAAGGSCSSGGAHGIQQEQQPQPQQPVSWRQELALVMLELQAAQRGRGSGGGGGLALGASPRLALSAVKGYLTAAEARQRLAGGLRAASDAASAVAARLGGRAPSAAGGLPHEQPAAAMAACEDAAQCTEDAQPGQLAHDGVLLQQLLAACPPLTVLPPEVLAGRWQLLLSGLLAPPEAAMALLRTSPYLLVDHEDAEQGPCGCGGRGPQAHGGLCCC